MIEFRFDAFELQYLCMVAERRNCGKQPNGVRNRRCDGQNDFSLNLHGVMGEYAVAKYLGAEIDTSISLKGDDKIADLRCSGKSIQVKVNMGRWSTKYLYFNSIDLFRADAAVLVIIRSATEVELAGWIAKSEFSGMASERNFGHGKRFCVESTKLRPIKTLKAILNEPNGNDGKGVLHERTYPH